MKLNLKTAVVTTVMNSNDQNLTAYESLHLTKNTCTQSFWQDALNRQQLEFWQIKTFFFCKI